MYTMFYFKALKDTRVQNFIHIYQNVLKQTSFNS